MIGDRCADAGRRGQGGRDRVWLFVGLCMTTPGGGGLVEKAGWLLSCCLRGGGGWRE